MSTQDNLMQAFAGESMANRKYLAFAQKAMAEGMNQVAKLFIAAAAAETVHAHAHLKAMGAVGSTADNLQSAVEGEEFEFTEMYPEYIEEAKKDENKAALKSFTLANAVEKIHHSLYQNALKAVKDGKDLAAAPIHVCSVCGNTVIGEAPEKCQVCGVPKSCFEEI
jgi:rubrerythrin